MPEYEKETTEQQRLEKEQLEDLGTVWRTRGPHAIHCLTVIGQIEGHVEAPQISSAAASSLEHSAISICV